MRFTDTALLLSSISLSTALNPNCAPGGNFDLSHWKLQLPIGKPNHPDEISADRLGGCSGYTNAKYFSTDASDGSLVLTVPGDKTNSDCVSTEHSDHCRCELRESTPSSWDPRADRNRLFGELKVTRNDGEICIGQIHVDDDGVSHKPVAELYYNAAGDLKMGVQLCAQNDCKQQRVDVDRVPRGQRFTYEIRYERNVLSVSINGKAFQKLDTHKLNGPKSYFKAGNYNQQSRPTEVHFYQIKVSH
ncbi:hypothetical protein LLEC1_03167 [Akanthomyces lecanii]|uniref:Alginate lyase 2 domain-containing protein n=1 Tax=Cordyceps confragosa TaxID=2714763 RepID=A0A179ID24_CORDF|nr:hypothetical protein LLEC1_03167 [Akanthomyces lecanii]